MLRFQIPDSAIPTFTELSKLSKEDTNKIVSLLQQVEIGDTLDDFLEIFKNTKLSKDIIGMEETIYSFGGLLANEKESDLQSIAAALTKAYEEKREGKIEENEVKRLNENLLIIFESADNLKKTFKAFHLFTENDKLYNNSRIITDMRLLFNDEIESPPGCGVILHQLKIEYVENGKRKSVFVSLNRDDVRELSENLQRALKKEEIIKENQPNIKFIELK